MSGSLSFPSTSSSFLGSDSESVHVLFERTSPKNLQETPQASPVPQRRPSPKSRAPVTCPFKDCGKLTALDEVLPHFLHHNDRLKDFFDVFLIDDSQEIAFLVDRKKLRMESSVLACLAYDLGVKKAPPIDCISMISIQRRYQFVTETSSLPILVLASQTEDTMLVWLVGVTSGKNLWAEVEVSSRQERFSCSQTLRVEALKREPPDPARVSSLVLWGPQIKRLTDGGKVNPRLSIKIFEYVP